MTDPKYPAKRSRVAAYLADRIDNSPKSQQEIAEALGYPNPNILSMFKTGKTKVPVEIIPKLAEVLECAPHYFVALAMQEYHPEVWAVVEKTLGHMVSANEMDIIETVRAASRGTDPFMDVDVELALTGLFKYSGVT